MIDDTVRHLVQEMLNGDDQYHNALRKPMDAAETDAVRAMFTDRHQYALNDRMRNRVERVKRVNETLGRHGDVTAAAILVAVEELRHVLERREK